MKRTLSLVLAFAMLFSVMASGLVSQALTFKDINDAAWAKTAVEYMSSYGVINGYPDGTFQPNKAVKKSEFIKMMNYTFGLTETTSVYYSDLKTTDWYYTDIAKAAANGYLTDSYNTVNGDKNLTREEAAAMLARYLKLEASSSYSTFTDYAQISYAYRDYVVAAAQAGIFQGNPDGSFKPAASITRAEALTVLNRIVGTFVGNGVNYASTSNAAITTSAANVTGLSLNGDLLITEGADNSTITLTNCSIYGDINIKARNVKLNLVNCTVYGLVNDATESSLRSVTNTITASGSTVVRSSTLKSAANIVDNTTGESTGFAAVITASKSGSTNSFSGSIGSITATTPSTTIVLNKDATVGTLTIEKTAPNTKVIGLGVADKLISTGLYPICLFEVCQSTCFQRYYRHAGGKTAAGFTGSVSGRYQSGCRNFK